MRSVIRSCLDGADRSRGIVVVIDVFRSSNTILMLLAKGAASVIPVATVEEAFRLRENRVGCLAAGERQGVTVPGFDMGNSPFEVSQMEIRGKDVVLTTSAGTQGMVRAIHAERMLIGSFGNARALVKGLNNLAPPLVTWLAVGTEGTRRAVEDESCAACLQSWLRGEPVDMAQHVREIMQGEGARRLERLGQEQDFSYCLSVDIFHMVPEVRRTEGRLAIGVMEHDEK